MTTSQSLVIDSVPTFPKNGTFPKKSPLGIQLVRGEYSQYSTMLELMSSEYSKRDDRRGRMSPQGMALAAAGDLYLDKAAPVYCCVVTTWIETYMFNLQALPADDLVRLAEQLRLYMEKGLVSCISPCCTCAFYDQHAVRAVLAAAGMITVETDALIRGKIQEVRDIIEGPGDYDEDTARMLAAYLCVWGSDGGLAWRGGAGPRPSYNGRS